MDTQLKKNIFARLFPAMAEPQATDDAAYSDPDREAPSTPTTRRFEMPAQAYVPPSQDAAAPQQGDPVQDDPKLQQDLSTLQTLSEYIRDGKKFDMPEPDKFDPSRYSGLSEMAQGGAPPPPQDVRQNVGGTDSFGRPYDPNAIDEPPALPESMRPKSAHEKALAKRDEVLNRKIEDKDHGVKKRIYEVIQNTLEGMSMAYKANPNGHWSGILAGGAAGGVIGSTLNKTWNEQRAHEKELGLAERDYQLANESAGETEKLAQSQTDREVKSFKAMTDREKMIYDALDEKKKAVLDQLKDIDEIDPNSKDPLVQEFIKKASDAGITVLPKKRGQKFTFDTQPDGTLIIGDTTSGAYLKGEGNYSKPASFSANELPDAMFGIKDEKSIDDEATASIAKEFPSRRRKPEVEQNLLQMTDEGGNAIYRNADGSLNEAKAIADGAVEVDKLYENSPSNYEQQLAGHRTKARVSQQALKTEVANFRTAISNQRPRSDAQEQPVSKVKDLFLKIMQLPPKQRATKLKAFYENLPNIRITG